VPSVDASSLSSPLVYGRQAWSASSETVVVAIGSAALRGAKSATWSLEYHPAGVNQTGFHPIGAVLSA